MHQELEKTAPTTTTAHLSLETLEVGFVLQNFHERLEMSKLK